MEKDYFLEERKQKGFKGCLKKLNGLLEITFILWQFKSNCKAFESNFMKVMQKVKKKKR